VAAGFVGFIILMLGRGLAIFYVDALVFDVGGANRSIKVALAVAGAGRKLKTLGI